MTACASSLGQAVAALVAVAELAIPDAAGGSAGQLPAARDAPHRYENLG